MPLDVVVIDDEEMFTEGCRQTLEMGGYRPQWRGTACKGLDLVRKAHPSVVLVDLKMPGMDGMEVLTELSQTQPSVVPIVVTGHGTVDSAVESMKIGAFDFLTKPFEPEKLLESVRRGMSLSGLRKAKETAEEKAEAAAGRGPGQTRPSAARAGRVGRGVFPGPRKARTSGRALLSGGGGQVPRREPRADQEEGARDPRHPSRPAGRPTPSWRSTASRRAR